MKNIIQKAKRVFGFTDFKKCADKSPIFWVIKESEEQVKCTDVEYYTKENELLYEVCTSIPQNQLAEEDIKRLNQIKDKIIKDIC